MGKWININERKPEKSGYYLITHKEPWLYDPGVSMGYYYSDKGCFEYVDGEKYITAWMEIPKPYEGDLNE